ncbi:MAG: hypothetical protein F2772_05115, partial [Actinobacteria bacterium]|nr:hypothetical protein [Actinomycetota bacterium]
MTDFGTESHLPPPPPTFAAPPPPPAQFGVPPQGYSPYTVAPPQKPPRPAVPVGSWLLIIGGAVSIAACFLTWYTIMGQDVNGFDDTFDPQKMQVTTNTGGVFVFFGVLALGFGIAQLAARRVLAVAILSVVFGAIHMLATLGEFSSSSDLKDFADSTVGSFSWGPGLPVLIAGSLLVLAGG